MPDSFKNKFKKLALNNKIIMAGSILMVLSVLMPWYSDVDRFNTGDTFLGITGPAYLAGLLVLVAGGMSLGLTVLHLMQKPIPKLPLKEKHFHIFTSGLSLLMTILASSIYFHAKFGVNITSKTMGIGMTLAFVGAGIALLGSLISEKKKNLDIDDDGHLEPLINLDTEDRVQGAIEKQDESVQNEHPEFDADHQYSGSNRSRGMVEEAITVGEAMRRSQQGDNRDIPSGGIPNIVEHRTNDIN